MPSRYRYFYRTWHHRVDQELAQGMHARSSFSGTHLPLNQIAHDYAKSSGNAGYRSVNLVGGIHQTLYSPSQWASFASGYFYDFYQEVVRASNSSLSLASRSAWTSPEFKRQSSQEWPDYTFQAISCGDSIDESNITTQAVFDELIRVVKDVSPMCKSPYFHQLLQRLIGCAQSVVNSLSLVITATGGPLVLSKGTLVRGTAS